MAVSDTGDGFVAPRTAWHRSALWDLASAYLRVGGLEAWDSNTVPSFATSNVLSARRFARLLVVHARWHDAGRPFALLEIGAGHGLFAAHVLDALARHAGAEGQALYQRLTYVVSDLSAANVLALTARDYLRPHVEQGRVVVATGDLFRDPPLVAAAERALPERFDVIVANYVCCAIPPRVLKREGAAWAELEVEAEDRGESYAGGTLGGLMARLDVRFAWAEAPLDALVDDPLHRAAVATLVAPWPVPRWSIPSTSSTRCATAWRRCSRATGCRW